MEWDGTILKMDIGFILVISRRRFMDINYFSKECERVTKVAEKYRDSYLEFFERNSKEVVRIEYGIGGEVLHRGFYCPSIILDIVVGNVKRGRIAKKKPMKSPERIYGFDQNNKLLTVEREFEKEFLIYEGQREWGFTFNNELSLIAESVYDKKGRIESYSEYMYSPFGVNPVDFIHREVYKYEPDRLVVDFCSFTWGIKGKNPLLSHDRFIFTIENTYLVSYTVECFNNDGTKKESVWDGHVFKVYVKRKVPIV